MLERLEARARRYAEAGARARSAQLAERMREALPPGITVEAGEDGVAIAGRGLARRWLIEPALRWMIGGLK